MTEQVYQCANKVSRSSSSSPSEDFKQECSMNKGEPQVKINITTTTQYPSSQKQDQTQQAGAHQEQNERDCEAHKASRKAKIFATFKNFMELGIYMCGPTKGNQAQQTKPMASKPLNQEEKTEENSAIDEVAEDASYIFEGLSTGSEEERDATPKRPKHKGTLVKDHELNTNYLPSQLLSAPADEQKREPAQTETNHNARMQDDISDLTESYKDEHSQSLESLDFHMMGDFDMVETNFFGTKKIFGTEPPRMAAAGYSTRFEI